jgi:lipid II:glycine glycyltransferase (peptidoglycan interpeptide bridge formation enzyme)
VLRWTEPARPAGLVTSERASRAAEARPGAAFATSPDGGWDAFVAATPGGDVVQSTAWAEAKRALGFEVEPVVVRRGGDIVGGARIVIRRFGALGGVGYVARGPLLAPEARVALVLDAIEKAARARRVRHLVVQPPQGGDELAAALADRGYDAGAPEVTPSATLRIDLSCGIDRIQAGMTASKRNQLRRSQRGGVEVRLAGAGELSLFHEMHVATAGRQGFAPLSRAYLQSQWDALHPRGWVQIFVARHGGRPLAAIWVTAFGESATYRLPAWTGEGRELQPNVACQWEAIRWAKAQGFRWYDFGGIERRHLELIVAGQPLPDSFHRSPDAMKREFGGDPVNFPGSCQRTFNPLARVLVRALYPRLSRNGTLHRLIHRLRNG